MHAMLETLSKQEELQWKRLRKLNLVGARFEYLTRVTPIDRMLAATVLPLLPKRLSPNNLTTVRFVLIPFVLAFLLADRMPLAIVLFTIAAVTDALDGALARTARRITKWGIIADPIADKLLVGSVGAIVVTKYLGWPLLSFIIVVEILLVASAYFRYRGRLMPAKTMGKIKMTLQCVGLGLLLLFALVPSPTIREVARYTLYLAVVFGVLSLSVYRSI